VLGNGYGLGHDSEAGTQDIYTIDGFQITYCTGENASPAYQINFYEACDACAVRPAIPTAAFLVSGLPRASVAGVQECWTVDIDLCAASLSFNMQADADQFYDGLWNGARDRFGWSFQLLTPAPHWMDGVPFAGSSSGTGTGYPCSGSDGTVFDSGIHSAIYPANSEAINLGCGSLALGASPEQGVGMGTPDKFRVEGSPWTPDGCYYFGSTPPADFYLQLYSANVVLPSVPPVPYCDPYPGGAPDCPCANPPAGSQRGCDNSAATGGASLTATGSPSLAADTLVLATAGELPTSTTILVQGTSERPSQWVSGVLFGQGVRCVAGTLRRLYAHVASSGSVTFPGAGDPSLSARSAALGDPIASGTHRYYFAMYRDPVVSGGCSASATFNCTNADAVPWN
jgi:hypothetical protein